MFGLPGHPLSINWYFHRALAPAWLPLSPPCTPHPAPLAPQPHVSPMAFMTLSWAGILSRPAGIYPPGRDSSRDSKRNLPLIMLRISRFLLIFYLKDFTAADITDDAIYVITFWISTGKFGLEVCLNETSLRCQQSIDLHVSAPSRSHKWNAKTLQQKPKRK